MHRFAVGMAGPGRVHGELGRIASVEVGGGVSQRRSLDILRSHVKAQSDMEQRALPPVGVALSAFRWPLAAFAVALCSALAGTPSPAHAAPYVIDGDTLDIDGERVRLRSKTGPIDAPELRKAQCPLELYRAEAARDRLRALVQAGEVRLERTGRDRYGRTVGVVYVGEQDVGAALVREGHAKPWPKLTKADRPTWCGPS